MKHHFSFILNVSEKHGLCQQPESHRDGILDSMSNHIDGFESHRDGILDSMSTHIDGFESHRDGILDPGNQPTLVIPELRAQHGVSGIYSITLYHVCVMPVAKAHRKSPLPQARAKR